MKIRVKRYCGICHTQLQKLGKNVKNAILHCTKKEMTLNYDIHRIDLKVG